jgi:hypothetical protein
MRSCICQSVIQSWKLYLPKFQVGILLNLYYHDVSCKTQPPCSQCSMHPSMSHWQTPINIFRLEFCSTLCPLYFSASSTMNMKLISWVSASMISHCCCHEKQVSTVEASQKRQQSWYFSPTKYQPRTSVRTANQLLQVVSRRSTTEPVEDKPNHHPCDRTITSLQVDTYKVLSSSTSEIAGFPLHFLGELQQDWSPLILILNNIPWEDTWKSCKQVTSKCLINSIHRKKSGPVMIPGNGVLRFLITRFPHHANYQNPTAHPWKPSFQTEADCAIL